MIVSTKNAASDRPNGEEVDLRDTRQTSRTILLVDDDVDLRNVYQLYLETKSFTVFSAGSVVEALRLMRWEPIHLVILDIFLEEDDGLEFLNGIVAAEIDVPVIVISGLSGNHDLFQKAIASGAAGVFTKWLPLDALFAEVTRVMAGEPTRIQEGTVFTPRDAAGSSISNAAPDPTSLSTLMDPP